MSVLDVSSGASFDSLSAAIAASAAGDVLRLAPGRYVENFPDITHDLTIESLGGLASLSTPQATPVNGRAILNVPGNLNVNLNVSGLELSGAVDPGNNGAGILFESGNGHLTVRNSWIHGNQDGILVGAPTSASTSGLTVRILGSEFDHNGVASTNPMYGYVHNLYVGAADSLDVENSYFHDALGGHEIKSRALSSTIVNNRIQDGASAPVSYSIDLPNGGLGTISGNVIEKGASAVNKYTVHFAGEGTRAQSSLSLCGNTFINDRPAGAVGLLNQSDAGGHVNVAATICNNSFYGYAQAALFEDLYAPPDTATGNVFLTGPAPALDTSSPVNFAVTEPSGAALLPLALLGVASLRRLSARSRATAPRESSATRSAGRTRPKNSSRNTDRS